MEVVVLGLDFLGSVAFANSCLNYHYFSFMVSCGWLW